VTHFARLYLYVLGNSFGVYDRSALVPRCAICGNNFIGLLAYMAVHG